MNYVVSSLHASELTLWFIIVLLEEVIMGIDMIVHSVPRSDLSDLYNAQAVYDALFFAEITESSNVEALREEADALHQRVSFHRKWLETRFGAKCRRLNSYVAELLESKGVDFSKIPESIDLGTLQRASIAAEEPVFQATWIWVLVRCKKVKHYPYRDAAKRLNDLIRACEIWGDTWVYLA